ncbi:MAG: hypothetical protein ABR529_01380 [Actinomycetota bacterium]
MTKPEEEKKRQGDRSHEEVELPKETLADLEAPDDAAEEAKGGTTRFAARREGNAAYC